MSVHEKIDQYFKLQTEIYEGVNYVEDWRVFPLDDVRDAYWMLIDEQMVWSAAPFTPESIESGNIYAGTIYPNKWIYRDRELTLAVVDTQTDGNIFMMVFDNSKECVDQALKDQLSEEDEEEDW